MTPNALYEATPTESLTIRNLQVVLLSAQNKQQDFLSTIRDQVQKTQGDINQKSANLTTYLNNIAIEHGIDTTKVGFNLDTLQFYALPTPPAVIPAAVDAAPAVTEAPAAVAQC
jgi:hypothetical protein